MGIFWNKATKANSYTDVYYFFLRSSFFPSLLSFFFFRSVFLVFVCFLLCSYLNSRINTEVNQSELFSYLLLVENKKQSRRSKLNLFTS